MQLPARPPRVSVVMTVLNPDPVYFPEAVESILAQTFDDLELIIVEDPSPRRAAELLARYQDPRIRHIANPQRTSLIDQKNQGLHAARADFVALLGGDDICEPNRLERQWAYLQAHPDVTVLGSQLAIIDSKGRHMGYRAYPAGHAAIVRAMPRYNSIADPSVIFRKRPIIEAGAYQYREHPAEDYELWCRLVTRGDCVFANHPEPLVRYRIHLEAGKATKLRGTLRATLDIKKQYFGKTMDLVGRARMWAERLLLWLPPRLVLYLFCRTQFRRSLPSAAATSNNSTGNQSAE